MQRPWVLGWRRKGQFSLYSSPRTLVSTRLIFQKDREGWREVKWCASDYTANQKKRTQKSWFTVPSTVSSVTSKATLPFLQRTEQELPFPLKTQFRGVGRKLGGVFYLHPWSQELHTFSLTVWSISTSNRVCFCSWYLAILNCLSFTVCTSFCGASLIAACSPH